MAPLAAAKLGDEMLRLVWRSGRTAAIDLTLRHTEVHAWFAGVPVYDRMRDAAYPPATYAILWPFLGWLALDPARWLWAATAVVALAAMSWLIVRESGADGTWERASVVLLLLAMNQTGVAVGNGQLVLHVLPALVAGLLLIQRGDGSWREDIAGAACVVFAMVKVTVAVPFLWLVLFSPSAADDDRRWPFRPRPALIVAGLYGALTVLAASFQPASLSAQLRDWLVVARDGAERGGDYGNLSAWLNEAGLGRLSVAAAVTCFIALGIWLYRYRRADLWVRLGVAGIVARLWTYHRVYDDVLVVLALVALVRIATAGDGEAPGRRVRAAAVALLVTAMWFMLLPARLGTSPAPWRQLFEVSHTATWLGMLAFLGWQPDRFRRCGLGVGGGCSTPTTQVAGRWRFR